MKLPPLALQPPGPAQLLSPSFVLEPAPSAALWDQGSPVLRSMKAHPCLQPSIPDSKGLNLTRRVWWSQCLPKLDKIWYVVKDHLSFRRRGRDVCKVGLRIDNHRRFCHLHTPAASSIPARMKVPKSLLMRNMADEDHFCKKILKHIYFTT